MPKLFNSQAHNRSADSLPASVDILNSADAMSPAGCRRYGYGS